MPTEAFGAGKHKDYVSTNFQSFLLFKKLYSSICFIVRARHGIAHILSSEHNFFGVSFLFSISIWVLSLEQGGQAW